jgi:hypothetical protein
MALAPVGGQSSAVVIAAIDYLGPVSGTPGWAAP